MATVADRIKLFLKAKGLTYEQFADEIGDKRHRVQDVLRGKQRLPEDMLQKIVEHFHVDANFLLTGHIPRQTYIADSAFPDESQHKKTHARGKQRANQDLSPYHIDRDKTDRRMHLTRRREDDFVMVPSYDIIRNVADGASIHSEQVVDYLAFRAEWVRNVLGVSQKDLALICVQGDSMEPTLSSEDMVLIDTSKGRLEDNAIYVLRHNGDLPVKRIQRKLDGSVIIKSDNPRYDQEILGPEMASQIMVVGRVIWSGRRM